MKHMRLYSIPPNAWYDVGLLFFHDDAGTPIDSCQNTAYDTLETTDYIRKQSVESLKLLIHLILDDLTMYPMSRPAQ